ncbi:TetR/AcrR family transcriptional regulator [Streptomyces sp. NBC_01016]|uniref:TetR/AcrR family transcriptional regulator n=1 Tax=Streptomyces sp. NBC_01016 TaxID=2903720 RepID=UPI002257ADD1|nr:TetR/AcrR family transcriptional regulator [Streptomyces sp. NBC_01016]MCX4831294.1 TetR/AcrR family transcriptional regulator [Streptomyces sp. NBC_01016]
MASWREQAVARTVDPVRARAEQRVQGFLDAALELLAGESGKDFTVQEVVRQSGQSLRSFYQNFGGKHELLLALLEESVFKTATRLREAMATEPDALSRLRRFTLEYHRLCRPPTQPRSSRSVEILGMAEFAQQLLTDDPKEAARAFAPIFALLEEILDDAAAEGSIRPGLDRHAGAGAMLQAIMFNSFALTLSGAPVRGRGGDAEALWDLLVHGVAAEHP